LGHDGLVAGGCENAIRHGLYCGFLSFFRSAVSDD
jgi:hypothetical protein